MIRCAKTVDAFGERDGADDPAAATGREKEAYVVLVFFFFFFVYADYGDYGGQRGGFFTVGNAERSAPREHVFF